VYDPWSTSRPPEEKHPMLVIVFSATEHVDCAFVFAAYKMRSDVAIAARSVVDIADKVMESRRRSGMTLLESRCDCLSGCHTRVTAPVTVDASVLPRWFSGRFRRIVGVVCERVLR